MKAYYISLKIDGYYAVHVNEDGYDQTKMVKEEDIAGFIQCLEFLGYEQ